MTIDEQHIIDFIAGDLPADKARDVQKAIASDPDLNELYSIHLAIHEARTYESAERLKAQMTSWKTNSDVVVTPRSQKHSKKTWRIIVIALLLIGGLAYVASQVFSSGPSHENLIATFYSEPLPHVMLMPLGDSISASYQSGVDAYKRKDFQGAAKAFATIHKQDPFYENARVLQLHSVFLLNQYDEAHRLASVLRKESTDTQTQQQTDWVFVMLSLAADKTNDAIAQLKVISNQPQHVYKRDAENLLDRLL